MYFRAAARTAHELCKLVRPAGGIACRIAYFPIAGVHLTRGSEPAPGAIPSGYGAPMSERYQRQQPALGTGLANAEPCVADPDGQDQQPEEAAYHELGEARLQSRPV